MAGYTDEAAGYLQEVRDRAGVPAYSNLSDQATCMSAILYERQIEFAYEGKRFDDMRRWLLFDGGAQFSTISGAPSTWALTGWGGNTCTWLGFKQFNGQRRENLEFRTADKYGVGGTTFDSDPLVNAGVTRPAGLDLRIDLSAQETELAQWYTDNLVLKQKRGDGYDSQHNLLYINFLPKYYFLGFTNGVQSANKTMSQTIGWEDYNNGGAMGTFDPLAE